MKPMPIPKNCTHTPVIVAHRGASGHAPENTLASFRCALELGADGIECDVQRSADGELVIFHDETVERTTNGTGLLREKTLTELKSLDAGSWFSKIFVDEKIPTLREAIEFLYGFNAILHIELKDPEFFDGIEAQVVALIQQMNFAHQVQIRSFHHPSLQHVHQMAPDIAISELWGHTLPDSNETHFPTINALHLLYTPETLAAIHARGQKATAWTVNDPETAQHLIAMGIDGLTTDYPDRLLKNLAAPR